jgi:hypothetical protein
MSKRVYEDQVEILEKSLQAALRPVAPRPEYKSYLHDRLVEIPDSPAIDLRKISPSYIYLAAIGLLGSLFLLIITIRSLAVYAQANRRQTYSRSM